MPLIPPNGVFYDGDYTVASPSSDVETSNPFPQQPLTQIFKQKFQQHADYFSPLALGTSPSAGGMTPAVSFDGSLKGRGPFLVGETERVDIGGRIKEWTRIWAHIPGMIYEFPAMNYPRQKYAVSIVPWTGFYDSWGNYHGTYRTYASVEEWTEPLTALVQRQFIRVVDSLTPNKMLGYFKPRVPYRLVSFNDSRGKQHIFELGTQGVADGTHIDRWMGDIWEVTNTYVQPTGYGPTGGVELQGNGFMGWNLPPTVTVDADGNPSGMYPATLYGGGYGGIGGDFG